MFSLPPLATSAGHITSKDQLTAYLGSAFGSGPHTVLLFLQDKVSPWDMKTLFLLCDLTETVVKILHRIEQISLSIYQKERKYVSSKARQ